VHDGGTTPLDRVERVSCMGRGGYFVVFVVLFCRFCCVVLAFYSNQPFARFCVDAPPVPLALAPAP